MNPTILLFFLLVASKIYAQGIQIDPYPPNVVHSKAVRIETMKDGIDCSIISYVPVEFNKTLNIRDDKNLGTFYFVSGKDCPAVFEQTFQSMNHQYPGEEFSPPGRQTLSLDSFHHISVVIHHETIAAGATKLYLVSLFKDNKTTDPRDDVYLGLDYVIDSGDPDLISSPFLLTGFYEESLHNPDLIINISANTYYKLREMIMIENIIVSKLREDGKLKDITPPEPAIKKLKLVKKKN